MPSELPLAYCANVHPGDTWDEAVECLKRFAPAVRRRRGRMLGVGLWMSARGLNQGMVDRQRREHLADWLTSEQISVYTMNAFPFGNFHADRVKQDVYRPDWTHSERANYTLQAAELLAQLLPPQADGSISTLPLAYGGDHPPDKDLSIYHPLLISVARGLATLRDQTGRNIRLAIEPEPACVLETTEQVIAFFQSLWQSTDGTKDAAAVREHLGICFDVCHQAVEFESIGSSLFLLEKNEVPIVKVHLSSAIELTDPHDDEARAELASFAEPRYLHQTYALTPGGRILKRTDLSAEEALHPGPEWLDARAWRIHFHVPIHRAMMGRLATTRASLDEALLALPRLSRMPHVEIETYTWGVLPGQSADLVDGLVRELESVDPTSSIEEKN
jgi:sugar phosphate isomerase/epimerase